MLQETQYSLSEILIDSLFASLSDLETNFVEIMLSRRDLSEKVDSLQTAMLVFKSASLKILLEQIGELLYLGHTTTDYQKFQQLRDKEKANTILRLQEVQKRRCIHQLRSLLREKMLQSSRVLNESYHTLSPADVHIQEQKLDQIASSVKMMEKDLGIEADDERASRLIMPRSPITDRFASRLEESFVRTQHDQSNILIKKSFLTCSASSLQKFAPRSSMDSVKIAGILHRKCQQLLRQSFDKIKTKQADQKKTIPVSMVTVIDHLSKTKSTSKDKTAKQPIRQTPRLVTNQPKPAITQLKQQSATSTSRQRVKKQENEQQKNRRAIKLDSEPGLFMNILKESYEDFAKGPTSQNKRSNG